MSYFTRVFSREVAAFAHLHERASLRKAERDARDALAKDDADAARRIADMGPAELEALKRALGLR